MAGYDWGGLASCVLAALRPDRVAGLVALGGYDVIDVAAQRRPQAPGLEHAVWYQHLLQSERGRAVLETHRRELCRMLWHQWSPRWRFDDALFARTAEAFDNPDFVDVVAHAYRHALGNAAGDPAYEALEATLAARPPITVPAVTVDGTDDPLKPGGTADHAGMFTGRHEHRVVDVGHALPYEAPAAFADAMLRVRAWTTSAG
ncbi:alpha/beta fold hydrolase [Actinomycetospora soli]|uniref:alpha/beta fold hydrolase n=1 Tax=Actinomycetospora soli TaxID=2893887 RepID=UPI001E3B5F4F|nr:alpha/beta hydrolase [Actinomycetospora soli]